MGLQCNDTGAHILTFPEGNSAEIIFPTRTSIRRIGPLNNLYPVQWASDKYYCFAIDMCYNQCYASNYIPVKPKKIKGHSLVYSLLWPVPCGVSMDWDQTEMKMEEVGRRVNLAGSKRLIVKEAHST